MKRSDFSYDLPPSLIAQEPRERGRSRMMLVSPRANAQPQIEHLSFADFPERLSPGDVLVINDTRVIPARLFAKPKAGMSRPIEILLTRRLTEAQVSELAQAQTGVSVPHQAVPVAREGIPQAESARARVSVAEAENHVAQTLLSVLDVWEAWCKPAKRVKVGDELTFSDTLRARVLAKNEGTVTIAFESSNDIDGEIERIGIPPLPPYIARETPRNEDRDAYQTVYAAERGAIAAPTAGLHFTPEILDRIAGRGIEIVRITLHVGIGTFKPVKVEDIAEHVMDEERYEISSDAASRLNAALDDHRTIVAVGTTSVRTLESAIRAGDGRFVAGRAATSIFITPGFAFRAVDKLLTNFHLPESTLLMLVSAFAGIETIRRAYAEAIGHQYFFYSYGDCMFLNGRGSW